MKNLSPKYLALCAKVFFEPLICVIISVRFNFQCYSLLSIEKTFPCLFFHCFFYSNFRKSCTLFIEFMFPHDIFLQGKILPHSPLPSTPPPKPKKIPENDCTLPNNHYYMQTQVKVCNLQPLPQEQWGSKSSPKT